MEDHFTGTFKVSLNGNTTFIPVYAVSRYISSTNQIMPHHNIQIENKSVIATSSIQVLTNHCTYTTLSNQCPGNRCMPDEPPVRTLGVCVTSISLTYNAFDVQCTLCD